MNYRGTPDRPKLRVVGDRGSALRVPGFISGGGGHVWVALLRPVTLDGIFVSETLFRVGSRGPAW